MRKAVFAIVTFFLLFPTLTLTANDTTITIGNGTDATSFFPIARYYNYSTWEGIYLNTEINKSGEISQIKFYETETGDASNITNIAVYLKHTTQTSLTTDYYSLTGYEQVFSGTLNNDTSSGWKTIEFDSLFNYNGNDNLSVLIIHDYQAYTSSYPTWRFTNTTDNMCRYAYSDYSVPSYLTASSGRPDIQLVIEEPLVIDAGIAGAICPGESFNLGTDLNVTGGTPPYTYNWIPTTGLNNPTSSNPNASPEITMQYLLTVSDAAGKQAQAYNTVYVAGETTNYYMNKNAEYKVLGGKFYDSGGNSASYSYNEFHTVTLSPCNPACEKVQLSFTSFDIESSTNCTYDYMKIYDGTSTSSSLIGTYCGSNSPGVVNATNPEGALTVVFYSDVSVTEPVGKPI